MKKLLLAGATIISVMALAATTDRPQSAQQASAVVNTSTYQDTVPRRKQPDTLPRPLPPDTLPRPLPPAE